MAVPSIEFSFRTGGGTLGVPLINDGGELGRISLADSIFMKPDLVVIESPSRLRIIDYPTSKA
jgi:hypothetical protein